MIETLSIFVDEVISEVVDEDVRLASRDEMEVEIWRRSEGSCQSEIAALHEELSKCYAKINKLSLKVQQLSLPPFSEETLGSFHVKSTRNLGSPLGF